MWSAAGPYVLLLVTVSDLRMRVRCTKCGVVKAADHFTRSRPKECRECCREAQRKCPSQTRQARAARMAKWRGAGGPKVEAARKQQNEKRRRGPYRSRADRLCRDCGMPLNDENNKPQHGRRCRSCRYERQLVLTPRADRNAANRAWRTQNRERAKSHQAKFHDAHPAARAVYVNRYRAKYGPARASGDLTPAQWQSRLDEFNHSCAYCLRTGVRLTQDHMEPIALGGPHTIENVVPACQPCNSRKHAKGILSMVNR